MSQGFTRGKRGNRGQPEARNALNALKVKGTIGPLTKDELAVYNSVFTQNGLGRSPYAHNGVRYVKWEPRTANSGKPDQRAKGLQGRCYRVKWTARGVSEIQRMS